MIEVMISLGIVAIMIVAFQSLIVHTVKVARANQSEFRANLYLREVIEITKALEQSVGGWTKLESISCSSSAKCRFVEQGTTWNIESGEDLLDSLYTRGLYIESLNGHSKKVTAIVSWFNGTSNRSLTLETYVYQGIY